MACSFNVGTGRWTATPDQASVASCIASTPRNTQVDVTAGSATWTSGITLSRGITLQGAGRDSVFISRNSTLVTINPDATAIANEETIKVDGITWDGLRAASVMFQIGGAPTGGTKPFKKMVITNNRFRDPSQSSSTIWYQSDGQIRGVIAGNLVERPYILMRCFGNDDKAEFTNSAYFPVTPGTTDNLFVEDNTITFTGGAGSGASSFGGWVECGQGGRIAFRYNTYNYTGVAGIDEVWDVHGFQNWPGGQTGTMLSEYYGNSILNWGPNFRFLFVRGGKGMYHNNVVTGPSGSTTIGFSHRSATSNGACYPAINATGGTSWPPPAVYIDAYAWNDTYRGSDMGLEINNGGQPGCLVVQETEFHYQASSGVNAAPCTTANCTAGVGRAITAPTGNCVTGTGFWRASTPTATTDPNVIQNGTFYKCTSTNTWTPFWTAPAYPHPLRSGVLPDTTPPAVPTGLQVV